MSATFQLHLYRRDRDKTSLLFANRVFTKVIIRLFGEGFIIWGEHLAEVLSYSYNQNGVNYMIKFLKSQWGAGFVGFSIGLILSYLIIIPAIRYWEYILR